jgi:hypothetical protein
VGHPHRCQPQHEWLVAVLTGSCAGYMPRAGGCGEVSAIRPPGPLGSVQGAPEAVARLGGAANSWTVLGEQLATGTG